MCPYSWYNFKYCRYGKQTLSGVIKDGMSAITRYYLNNFHDGVRQARHLIHLSNDKWKRVGAFNYFLSFLTILCIFYQDALDLISGHYTVNRNGPSPFQLNGFETFSVSELWTRCHSKLWQSNRFESVSQNVFLNYKWSRFNG